MDWITENSTTVLSIVFVFIFLFKSKIMSLLFRVKSISNQELKQMIDTGKELIIIDVRNREEFSQKNIPQAINIPLPTLTKEHLNKLKIERNSNIYVICASGSRSLMATMSLKKWGFTSPINVSGGMIFF